MLFDFFFFYWISLRCLSHEK